MATKINPVIGKKLAALGISAKTEEEARKKLLEILNENGIDGMEEEDTDTLIEIAEACGDEEEAAKTEEEEMDELAEEVEEEDEEVEAAEEEEDEEDEEDEEPEEEVEVKNAKPVKKVEKPVKKVEKLANVESVGKKRRLNPKTNSEDRKYFLDTFKDIFPDENFEYAWVASAGVTIKYKGENSSRGIVSLENASLQSDGSIRCNLYFLTLAKNLEVLDNVDIDYAICWSGAPFVKGITFEKAKEVISDIKDSILPDIKKMDKRLGENRKKMEESLKATNVKKETVVKKTTTKKSKK